MTRAIVIDAESTMRKIVTRSLHMVIDAEVEEASSVIAALPLLTGRPLNVIVARWELPGERGRDVVDPLRAVDVKVPIVIYTSLAVRSVVHEAIDAGVNGILLMPFTADTLNEKLRRYLPLQNGIVYR